MSREPSPHVAFGSGFQRWTAVESSVEVGWVLACWKSAQRGVDAEAGRGVGAQWPGRSPWPPAPARGATGRGASRSGEGGGRYRPRARMLGRMTRFPPLAGSSPPCGDQQHRGRDPPDLRRTSVPPAPSSARACNVFSFNALGAIVVRDAACRAVALEQASIVTGEVL